MSEETILVNKAYHEQLEITQHKKYDLEVRVAGLTEDLKAMYDLYKELVSLNASAQQELKMLREALEQIQRIAYNNMLDRDNAIDELLGKRGL